VDAIDPSAAEKIGIRGEIDVSDEMLDYDHDHSVLRSFLSMQGDGARRLIPIINYRLAAKIPTMTAAQSKALIECRASMRSVAEACEDAIELLTPAVSS